MKKALLILISVICLISCDNRTEEQRRKDYQAKKEKARQDSIREVRYHGFKVIVIDSCEYLIKTVEYDRGYKWATMAGYFGHKGNCKFCEERRKQENKTANNESE